MRYGAQQRRGIDGSRRLGIDLKLRVDRRRAIQPSNGMVIEKRPKGKTKKGGNSLPLQDDEVGLQALHGEVNTFVGRHSQRGWQHGTH